MNDRVIFHVDVNSAFLSWESVWNLSNGGSEDYRKMLAAVGGDIETRHGIIVAKSILTKPYGVTTGEPVVNALRKCPNLVLIKPHHEIYKEYSKALMAILREYTDTIEQFSIDEAFLDMTGTAKLFGPPVEAADQIRNRIRDTLGFTVNVGVSSNKLLAKMASDFVKPDKTHTLWPEEVPSKMWPLPVGDLFFVGSSTAAKLNSLGIRTIGELANSDRESLKGIFKSHGEYMYKAANGTDDSPVYSQSSDPKGYSNETTTSYDIVDSKEALTILRSLTEKVSKRIRDDGVRIECVEVHLRYNTLKRVSRQCRVSAATNITDEIFDYVCSLFKEKWDGTPIRLLGVRLSDIAEESYRQISMFESRDYEKLEKLDHALDEINTRFGTGTVKRASGIKKKETETKNNDQTG